MKAKSKKTFANGSSKPKSDSYKEIQNELIGLGFDLNENNKMTESNMRKLLEKYNKREIISDSSIKYINELINESTISIQEHITYQKCIEFAITSDIPKIKEIKEYAKGSLYTDETEQHFIQNILPELSECILTDSEITCCKANILLNYLETGKHNDEKKCIEYDGEYILPVTSTNSVNIKSIINRLTNEPDLKIAFLDVPEVSRKSVAIKLLLDQFENRIFKL
jgi:hypothetical protein